MNDGRAGIQQNDCDIGRCWLLLKVRQGPASESSALFYFCVFWFLFFIFFCTLRLVIGAYLVLDEQCDWLITMLT